MQVTTRSHIQVAVKRASSSVQRDGYSGERFVIVVVVNKGEKRGRGTCMRGNGTTRRRGPGRRVKRRAQGERWPRQEHVVSDDAQGRGDEQGMDTSARGESPCISFCSFAMYFCGADMCGAERVTVCRDEKVGTRAPVEVRRPSACEARARAKEGGRARPKKNSS